MTHGTVNWSRKAQVHKGIASPLRQFHVFLGRMKVSNLCSWGLTTLGARWNNSAQVDKDRNKGLYARTCAYFNMRNT